MIINIINNNGLYYNTRQTATRPDSVHSDFGAL